MKPLPHQQPVVALLSGGRHKLFDSIESAATHFNTTPDRAAKWLDDAGIGSYRGEDTCLRLQSMRPSPASTSSRKVRGEGTTTPRGLRVTYASGKSQTFKSLSEASLALGVSIVSLRKWLKQLTTWATRELGITSIVRLTRQVRITFQRSGVSKTFANYPAMAEWLGISEPRMYRWANEGVPSQVQAQYGTIFIDTEVS